MSPTPAEEFAALITGQPAAETAAAEPPTQRAPRPDRSQGQGATPTPDLGALFNAAIERSAGPAGVTDRTSWTHL